MNQSKPIVVGIIPARYGSSRFRGKIIAPITGKPMIQWVYERAKKSELLDELYVAVDDVRVQSIVKGFGGKAIMTGTHHQSGTDRIGEVIQKVKSDIIVNIQGDQPIFDPLMIDEAVQPLIDDSEVSMSTLKTQIEEADYNNPDVVKVVVDENDYALYFSRSLLPYPRHDEDLSVFEHIGIYVYRKDFLQDYLTWPQGKLEKIESLEQLRVLEKGYKILVIETKTNRLAGTSVDTREDLEKVEKIIKEKRLGYEL